MTQPPRIRPTLTDYLHRSFTLGLVGITLGAVGMMWVVHRDTLRRGEEALREMEAKGEGLASSSTPTSVQTTPAASIPASTIRSEGLKGEEVEDERREQKLAELALAAYMKGRKS